MSRLILPRRALLKAGAAALITSPAIIGKAMAQLNGGLMFPGPGTPHSGGVTPFTWNPADAATGITLANSNRDVTGDTGGSFSSVRSTLGKTTGLWYCEFFVATVDAGAAGKPNTGIGLANASFVLSAGAYLGSAEKSVMYYWVNQGTFQSASFTVANAIPASQSIATSDTLQIAADLTNGKVWLGQNNTWKTGSPSAGTSPWLTFTAGSDTWFFSATENAAAGSGNASTMSLPSSDVFSPPTGFTTINA